MIINKREVRMQFWPVLLLVNLLLYPVIITAHILPTHTTYLNNNNGPTSTAYLASSSFPSPSPTATAYVNLVPRTATASYPTSLHHATYIATPLPSTKASPDSSGASASDDASVATNGTISIPFTPPTLDTSIPRLNTSLPTLDTSSPSLSATASHVVQEAAGVSANDTLDSTGTSASDDTYVATTDTKTIFPISTLNTSSSSLSAAAYDLVQEVASIPRDASPFPLLYDDHAARPAVDLQHRQPLHLVNGSADVSFDSMENNLPVNNTSDITHSETESVRAGSNVEPTFAEPDRLVTPELDRMNILRRLALSSQERPRVVRVYGPVQGVTIAFSSSWSWNTQKNPPLTDPITEEWYAAIENMERKYLAFDASRYRQEAATAEAEPTIRRADHIIDIGRKQSLELAAKLQYVDGITKVAERAYNSQVLTLAYARKYAFVRVMGAFMFKRHRDMTNPYSTAMTIYQRPLYPPLPPLLLWFCKATTWNVKAGKWLRQVALVLQKVAWMLRAVLQQASLYVRQAWLALQDTVAILLCWLAFIYVVLGNSAFSSATAEINNLPGSYDRHLQVSGLGDVGSELAMGPVNERNNEQTNGANDAANETERTNGDDDEQRGRQAFNLGSRSTQWPTEDSRIIQRILLKNGRYHQRARSWSPIRAAGSSIRDRNRIIGVERFAMPSPVASVPVVSVSLIERAAEPVTPASRSDLTTTELPPDPKRTRSPWSQNDNDADGTKVLGHELARPDGPTQAITLGSVPSTRGASRSEVTEVDVVPAVCLTAPVKAEVQSNVAPPSVSSVSEAPEQALLARPDIETRDIAQFSTPSNVPAKTGMSSSVEISLNVREMMAPPQSIVAYNKLAARVEDAVDDDCPVQGAHIIVSTPVQNKVKRGTTTPVKPPSEAAFQSAVEIARVFSQGSLPPSAVQVCDTALLSSTSALPDATNAAVDACVVDVVTALVQVPLDSIEVINVDAAPAVVPPVRKFRGLPKKVQRKLTVRSLQHEEAIPAPVGNGTFQDLDLPNVENVAPGPGCFETAPAQTDVSAAINSAPRLSSDEPVRKLWTPEAKRPCQQPHLERPSPNPLVDSARQNLAPSEVQGQIVGPARPEGPAQELASVAPDIGQPLPSNVSEIPSGILLPIGVNTMMSVPPEVQEPMPMYMDVQEPMSSSTQMNAQERMGSPRQMDAQEPIDSPFDMDVQEPVSSPTQMDAQERMGSPTQMDAQEPMGSPIDMVVQATPVTNATPMPSRSFGLETSSQSFVLDTPTPATRIPLLGELRNYSPPAAASLDRVFVATARLQPAFARPAVQSTNFTRLGTKPIERADVFSERAYHASFNTTHVSVPSVCRDRTTESQMEAIAEESEVDVQSERGDVGSEAFSGQILAASHAVPNSARNTPTPATRIPRIGDLKTFIHKVRRKMSNVVAAYKVGRDPSSIPRRLMPSFNHIDLIVERTIARKKTRALGDVRQMEVDVEVKKARESTRGSSLPVPPSTNTLLGSKRITAVNICTGRYIPSSFNTARVSTPLIRSQLEPHRTGAFGAERQNEVRAEEGDVGTATSGDGNDGARLAASASSRPAMSIGSSRSGMSTKDDSGNGEEFVMTDADTAEFLNDFAGYFDDSEISEDDDSMMSEDDDTGDESEDSAMSEDDDAEYPEDSAMTDDEEDVPLSSLVTGDVGMRNLDGDMNTESDDEEEEDVDEDDEDVDADTDEEYWRELFDSRPFT